MGAIFGGSKSKQSSSQQSSSTSSSIGGSKSSSWNQAYAPVASLYGGEAAQRGVDAGGMVSDALMGGQGAADAFGAYKKSIGYDQLMKDAMGAVSGKFGALGLGNSGAALRESQRQAGQIGQQAYGSWLDRLFGVQDRGMAGTAQMVNAGNRNESESFQQSQSQSQSSGTSNGSSNSKNGLGGLIGGIASGIAGSDRRLKKNIVKIGDVTEDVGLYRYNYINSDKLHVGVMADEVEQHIPDALGPVIDGYKTVNYDVLKERFGAWL